MRTTLGGLATILTFVGITIFATAGYVESGQSDESASPAQGENTSASTKDCPRCHRHCCGCHGCHKPMNKRWRCHRCQKMKGECQCHFLLGKKFTPCTPKPRTYCHKPRCKGFCQQPNNQKATCKKACCDKPSEERLNKISPESSSVAPQVDTARTQICSSCPQPCNTCYTGPQHRNNCPPVCNTCPAPCIDNCTSTNCGSCNLVHIELCAPSQAILGQEIPLEVKATALDDVVDVTITDTLPVGMTFVRSEPPAQIVGNTLTWRMNEMKNGQVAVFKIWVMASQQGCHADCISVVACTRQSACIQTFIGKPALSCTKCAPPWALPGDTIVYEMSVTNTGTLPAHGVVATDTLPDGVETHDGQKTVTWDLGDLCPNETRKLRLEARVCQPGTYCNHLNVTSCDAGTTHCQACTKVPKCLITLNKTGPTELWLCKPAKYTITSANTGEADLHNVIITDEAAPGTMIVEAPGAEIYGNIAVWRMDLMKQGEVVNYTITISACCPGCYTGRVNACTSEGPGCSAEATTCWKGLPALHMCATNCKNPLCIGETTVYNIQVDNQGIVADHNVLIKVTLPAQLTPVSASGGTVSGQTITFAPMPEMQPGQCVNFSIEAKAVQSGQGIIRAEMSSDTLKTAVHDENNIQVY